MKRRQRSVEFPPHRNFADDSNVVVVAPGSGDALGERPMNGEETGYGVEKEKDRRGLKDSAREGEEVDDSEDGSEDDSGKSSGSSSSEEDEDEDEDGSDDEDSDEESDSESDEEISEDDSEDDSDSDDSSEDDSSDDSDSDSNAEDSEESSEDDDSEEDSDSGVEEDVRDSSKRGERNARKKGKGKTKTKTEDLSVKPKKGSLKGHRSRKSTKRVVKRVTSKAAGKRKRDQNTEGRASSSAKRSRREKVADKQSASGTRGKRSLSFRSPKIKKNDRLKKPPAMRRLTEDEKLPAQDSAATEKTRRDQEYLATFRARLTPEGRERLRDECTLQRLIVSSAVYDSLARNKRGAGVPGRGHSQGVLDNVSLKFTVSQEVYLALFQTYGTSRRLQTRGKGQVPSSFRAFAAFRKALKRAQNASSGTSKIPQTAVSEAWRNLPESERKKYYDEAEKMSRKKEKKEAQSNEISSGSSAGGKDSPPVLREFRKFENLDELSNIFGPASMMRVVGSMLTPSGRVKVQHFVRGPVLLKFDGDLKELSLGFHVAAKFMPLHERRVIGRRY